MHNIASPAEPMTEADVEQRLRALKRTAPRITPAHIDDILARATVVQYLQPVGTTVTFCIITLETGFTVTGESATVHIDTFDAEIGQELAFKEARNKLWLLEGYRLSCALHENRAKVPQG